MSLILDAGALIAYERGARRMRELLIEAAADETPLVTSTTVIAQVWRGTARQAVLAQLLQAIEEIPFSRARSRATGVLLARSRTADIADASLVELAHDGDEILTSDPDDLALLARASGKTLLVTPI